MTGAVVLHFGRQSGGEARRTETWKALLESTGAAVTDVVLVPNGVPRRPHGGALAAILAGRAAPEVLAWSPADVMARLRRLDPDLVVCQTARAFHPSLVRGPWTTVLDFVDRMSASYRQRATITSDRWGSLAFRALSAATSRVESASTPGVIKVAAGWSDAYALDAQWLPNLLCDTALQPVPARPASHDVVFFGTLDYLPNVDALHRLGRILDLIPSDERPSALVAGRGAGPDVVELAREREWTLLHDFGHVSELAAMARVAVAPMTSVAGIQNKVLEAAAVGLAQVASPQALAGFRPGLPIAVAQSDAEFAAAIMRLVRDPGERARQVESASAAVHAGYSVPGWAAWAQSLVARPTTAPVN
jgi:hypothetical protein